MLKSTVEPECTGQFSPLFIDYIRQQEKLAPFYNAFPKLENFGSVIHNRQFDSSKRAVLVEALKAQYEGGEISEKVAGNVAALENDKTFTVTTGHQLNLFTGPLYFIYKIVSTINLAKQLGAAYPAYRFVPVYWMASEDHDFEEINYFYYAGKKYSWNTTQKGAVGDFELDGSMEELLKEASFVPDFFKEAYRKNTTLAEAVRQYVHHLFGDQGLVIVDGHDRKLKELFIPVIKEELCSGKANDLVNAQSQKLEELGYKSQIFPREINFFYLDKGVRSRIVKTKEGFEVLDTGKAFAEEELLKLVEEDPARFSPNVVLRPLYQEYILPNIAYLGGPAEVAYWLQLKSVFDHYEVDYPMVMPRNFAMIKNVKAQRKAAALGLDEQALFAPYDELKKRHVKANAQSDLDLTEEKRALSAVFEHLGDEAAEIDTTLKHSAEAAKVRALKVLEHFGNKLRQGEERKMDVALRRLKEVKEILFPGGTPQERKVNFLEFYLADEQFIDGLYAHFDPLDFNYMILEQDG
ncbi:bacillithiol biosynthesis cysteine-adding enzyme BshC [Echinicola strongylocentroti]|uniref:Putative cysteine ligase BshC n=1 Tax=Echinicola strongylocentroti TaxID=1795355 RepID=A0A2Z4IK47_9BACT|nr:bacillithiol biosynthesis cysteine-adding enzyme BshC [Echinicola strongylocentroti]AWW31060.1 bacillithiol biosynthesis cysteine-adding enzyme BshC [Echinicola strongylocentroti]